MRMRVVALTPDDFDRWKANQQTNAVDADDEAVDAGQAQFSSLCASCHQVDGLLDADGEPIVAQPQTQVYNGAAPNLTHLMSRRTFVGANFDLLNEGAARHRGLAEDDPEAFGAAYLEGTTPECLNRVALEAWLRDPPGCCRCTSDDPLGATDGKRGMPNLDLTEDQIDQLVAYLQTLNPASLGGGDRDGHHRAVPEPRRCAGPATVTPDAASACSAGPGYDRVEVVVVHGRPQEDRDHVRRRAHGVLRRRRHRGAADPPAARPAGTASCCRPTPTTRCSRCTPRRWCSSSSCRWRRRSATTSCPLQIGARDVAFPRLNAFGFWAFLFGGLFLNLSWFLGGGADGGWFMYAPNSGVPFSPTHGIDFWALGLQITGIASLTGAINLIVTVLNMRAPRACR